MRMTRIAFVSAAAIFFGSGCIIVSNEDKVQTADLTVLYTFGGEVLSGTGACSDVGISTIRVQVSGVDAGSSTTSNGSCASFSEGMTIKGLQVGRYDVLVTALDSKGNGIYRMTAPRRVVVTEKGADIDVDVPALFGRISVYWNSFGRFSGGSRCSDAGVVEVRAVLYDDHGGLVSDDYLDCSHQGVVWDLDPGTYEVVLNGLDTHGHILYAGDAFVEARVGEHSSHDIDLHAMAGSLAVWWNSFGEHSGDSMCSDAGVVEVRAVLYDDHGGLVSDDYFDCSHQGVVWDLDPGSYDVVLNGLDYFGEVIYAGDVVVVVVLGEESEYEVDLDLIVGDLTILWRFDGDTSCGLVTQIQVHLYDPSGVIYDSAVYECEDHGGLTYSNLRAGDWIVVLEAEGQGGEILYRTQGDWVLTVVAGELSEYYVELE